MNNPAVSIIIVNYHSLDLISDCIKSIEALTVTPFEIIIISNSNEHQSKVNSITKNYSPINYIETGSNLGFSKACNIGAKNALGESLFFLNPDTVLINNVIDLLYKKLTQDPQLGLTGPALFDSKGKPEPSIVGHINSISLLSLAFPFLEFVLPSKFRNNFYSQSTSGYVDVIHGSSMLISSQLFKEIGGMNESFFLYCEERDLCLNVKKAGYKVYFFAQAKLMHLGSGTSTDFLTLEIERHRSKKKLIKEYYPHLVLLNRICGVLGYGFRVILKSISINKTKIQQFRTLFKWYLCSYK